MKILFLVLSCLGLAEPQTRFSAPSRIVSVGDIHGNYDGLLTLLKDRKLIDENKNWIGGDSHLVFSGDILHRGDASFLVIQLIMKLEKQALERGGHVTTLLGNHDLMVLTGHLESDKALEKIKENEFDFYFKNGTYSYSSNKERQSYDSYAQSTSMGKRLSKNRQTQDDWPGYLAAFNAKDSDIAQWMRTRPAVVNIDGHLFVHAALLPDRSHEITLENLNQAATLLVSSRQEGGTEIPKDHPLRKEADFIEGPLTTSRQLGEYSNLQIDIDRMLFQYGAKTLTVGHQVTHTNAIEEKYKGKIYFVDTGMSLGKLSALEMIRKPDGKVEMIAYNHIGTDKAASVLLHCIKNAADLTN